MSIQFNFFATVQDELLIAREILSVLGTIYSLPDREKLVDMVPSKIQKPEDLLFGTIGKQCYLYQESVYDDIVLEPIPKGLHCVRLREFACLEYCPSYFSEDGILHRGRFAYFYTEDENFKRTVQKLYRRLRKHALKVPKNSSFWIFEAAAQSVPHLAYSLTMIKPNPLYVGDDDVT